jgi:hypothetical protein
MENDLKTTRCLLDSYSIHETDSSLAEKTSGRFKWRQSNCGIFGMNARAIHAASRCHWYATGAEQ